jgi:hypothetical protein
MSVISFSRLASDHQQFTHDRPKKGKRLSFELQNNVWKISKNSMSSKVGKEKNSKSAFAGLQAMYALNVTILAYYLNSTLTAERMDCLCVMGGLSGTV